MITPAAKLRVPRFLRRAISGYMSDRLHRRCWWGMAGARFTWRPRPRRMHAVRHILCALPRVSARQMHLITHRSGCLLMRP